MRTILPASAHVRLVWALALGVLTALFTGMAADANWAVLLGLTAMALVFVVLNWAVLWPMDTPQTRDHAVRDRYNPLMEELLIVSAAVVSMAGMVMVMIIDKSGHGPVAALIGLVGVFLSWAMLHLMYATQYAHVYFSADPPGGLDFGALRRGDEPCYADFLYFSFMIGMTYGTTDINVSTTALRAMVLRHGLLAFVFGTVILATGVSLVSGIFT